MELLLLIKLILLGVQLTNVDALTPNYYAMSCPFAEFIVRNTVSQALRDDPSLAGGLLRLHFHDCFVQGCDASVLIDSTGDNMAEKNSTANLSLRGYEVIDQAKQFLESQCPGVVSCADIVAMAARDAVYMAGGPYYDVAKGRKDGRRSKIQDTINLPPPSLNSTALIQMFGQHGFSVQDLVALAGAHTLGVARCANFKQRLSNFDANNDVDPTLDSNYARRLSRTCSAGDDAQVGFDFTSNRFDLNYFYALQGRMGLLASDQTLYSDPQTQMIVNGYAMNQARFFNDFQQAMVKMGSLDVKEGNEGEIRLNCRRVN
ncbi:peroxidase 47-like [Canna indica]|uniref:Peroxidase n=1 Tax=Canna indica TaxID=4628 RepID=A0AAQ3JQR6_9LILI|nr:peroxidase 47-like [Canna indica]